MLSRRSHPSFCARSSFSAYKEIIPVCTTISQLSTTTYCTLLYSYPETIFYNIFPHIFHPLLHLIEKWDLCNTSGAWIPFPALFLRVESVRCDPHAATVWPGACKIEGSGSDHLRSDGRAGTQTTLQGKSEKRGVRGIRVWFKFSVKSAHKYTIWPKVCGHLTIFSHQHPIRDFVPSLLSRERFSQDFGLVRILYYYVLYRNTIL